jgi:hypothetical protein
MLFIFHKGKQLKESIKKGHIGGTVGHPFNCNAARSRVIITE